MYPKIASGILHCVYSSGVLQNLTQEVDSTQPAILLHTMKAHYTTRHSATHLPGYNTTSKPATQHASFLQSMTALSCQPAKHTVFFNSWLTSFSPYSFFLLEGPIWNFCHHSKCDKHSILGLITCLFFSKLSV